MKHAADEQRRWNERRENCLLKTLRLSLIMSQESRDATGIHLAPW